MLNIPKTCIQLLYTHTQTHTLDETENSLAKLNKKERTQANLMRNARRDTATDTIGVERIIGACVVTWPLIQAPQRQRQRQMGLCEFEASLVYIMSSSQSGLHNEILSQEEKVKRRVVNFYEQLYPKNECSPGKRAPAKTKS